MQIIKPNSLSLIHRTLFQDQRYQFCVSPLLFFSLSKPDEILPEQVGWQRVMASLGPDEVLDVGAPKQHAEVLLNGTAMPIMGHADTHMRAGFCVHGVVEKFAEIHGDQAWTLTSSGWRLNAADPLKPTPITWSNAYGGPTYADNLAGKGVYDPISDAPNTELALPNVRSLNGAYDDFARIRDGLAECVSFGPQSLTCPERQQRAGTYDDHWFEHDYPGLAKDHDPAIHNMAQPDQWATTFFMGDERFDLYGFRADGPRLSGKLPAMRTRAFVQKTDSTSSDLLELDTHMDTLWLFPDQDMAVLISRGVCAVQDSDSLDVQSLMIAYERTSEPARTLDYYRHVHRLRTSPDTALAHLLHESQLTPVKTRAQLEQETSDVASVKRQRQQLVEANLKSNTEKVDYTLAQHGPSQRVLSELQAHTPDASDAKKQAQQLRMLMDKASKLASLFETDEHVTDNQRSAAEVKATLATLQSQPLNVWSSVKTENVDLTELANTVDEFATRSQPRNGESASQHFDRVVKASGRLQESLNEQTSITKETLLTLGVDINELTEMAQGIVNMQPAQQPVKDPINNNPMVDIETLRETLSEVSADNQSTPTAKQLEALIRRVESNATQSTSIQQTKKPGDKKGQHENTSEQQAADAIDAMPVITPQAIERGDIDLTQVIAAAEKTSTQCEQQGKAALAKIDQRLKEIDPAQTLKNARSDPERPLLLIDVKDELEQRFKPVQGTELIEPDTLAELDKARKLARVAAPFDSTNAKRFTQEVSDFLREKVVTLIASNRPLNGLDLSGANLSGLDFRGQNLIATLFESADLTACNFSGVNLKGAVLAAAKIDQAQFDECCLDGANLSSVNAKQVGFLGCSLDQAHIRDSSFHGCNFSNTNVKTSIVQDTTFEGCRLQNACFVQVQWVNCAFTNGLWKHSEFNQCTFMNSQLTAADFSHTRLTRCIFAQADVSSSRFIHAQFDTVQFAGDCQLDHSDFSHSTGVSVGLMGLDLSYCTFVGSAFKESNFSDGVFHYSNFNEAGFLRCVFSGASMRNVTSHRANYTESLMRKSHWRDSSLHHVEFFNADVKQAIFEQCSIEYARNMGPKYEVRA